MVFNRYFLINYFHCYFISILEQHFNFKVVAVCVTFGYSLFHLDFSILKNHRQTFQTCLRTCFPIILIFIQQHLMILSNLILFLLFLYLIEVQVVQCIPTQFNFIKNCASILCFILDYILLFCMLDLFVLLLVKTRVLVNISTYFYSREICRN